jgi:hypothetical protein
MNYKDKALEYLSYGLNPVPVVNGTKEPARKGHSKVRITEQEVELYDWDWIGFSAGSVSQGIEVLDFDLKNAEDPDAITKGFKSKVSHKLLSKLVFQRTQSGGFHIIYRCESLEGNRKLANNAEGDAVIETRGEGGFIVCAPSPGYEIVQGDFSKIPIISPEERLELFVSCRMLNKQMKKEAEKKRGKVSSWHDKFPDYDSDISVAIQLLEKHDWTVNSEDEDWINFTRPGKDHGISAGYHKEGMFLYVFTSSTNFEPEKPYNNHAIYAELECGGRYDVAYAKLFEQGHGSDDIDEEELSQFEWSDILENVKFISSEEEEDLYLEQARQNKIPLGLSTGWPALDPYMRIKKNSLNFGIAYDGVGKSVFMTALAMSTNVLYEHKWGMVVPENKTAVTRKRLIETASGQQIAYFNNKPEEYKKYLKRSREGFKIVTNKKHYSLKEVIQMGVRMYEEYQIDHLLIDPYNFFRVDARNGYSWNNEILSELRVFAEKYCSVWVMAHPSSDSPRKNKDQDGYLTPPAPYEIQGGADFPYRVDDFFVLHRIKNHRDEEIRRTMQLIMTKIKEEETGGKVHSKDEYSELLFERKNNFLGYWDVDGNNPIYNKAFPKGKKERGLQDFAPAYGDSSPFD